MIYKLVTPIKKVREALQSELKKSQKVSDFSKFIEYVKGLTKRYAKMIKIIKLADQRSRCFDFAFGVSIGHKNAVSEVINHHELIRKLHPNERILPGDIAIYFLNTNTRDALHAGKVIKKNVIESKWERGPIIQHSIFMIPVDYGNNVRYYRITDNNGTINFLRNYRPT